MEAELVVERTTVTLAENLVKKKDEEIQMAERALRNQSAEVENYKKNVLLWKPKLLHWKR